MLEPSEITIGFQTTWTIKLADYLPSNNWTLKYSFQNKDNAFTLASIADGEDHVIDVEASDWTNISAAAGVYWVTKYVENTDGTKIKLDRYSTTILANPLGDTVSDNRTHARKMLEALEAVEEGRATYNQSMFRVGAGSAMREIQYLSGDELLKWKNHYKRICYAEEGKSSDKPRYAKFSNPS